MFFREIIYAPLIEEILYRGIIFQILNTQIDNVFYAALISSVLFGISHLRHLLEKETYEDLSITTKQVLFQVCFTTVFGLYASMVYFQTKSLLSSIILHMFCNFLGLPKFSYTQIKDKELVNRITTYYKIGIASFLLFNASYITYLNIY